MPPIRTRLRQRLIQSHEAAYARALSNHLHAQSRLPHGELSSFFTLARMHHDTLQELYQTRYVRPRVRRPASAALRKVLSEYNDDDFIKILRLSRGQVSELIDLIILSPHFKIRDGVDRQRAIELRLWVTLFRLGTRGCSINKVAWFFGIGVGSVQIFTWQTIYAIVDLQAELITWPDEERKEEIASWFKDKMFPDAIGAVDGVPFPFEMAPSYNTHEWNTYKCKHAMGATAVCDHQGRFTFVSTGYVGSMHDALAYKKCSLYTSADDFFRGRQYIIGDAAYMVSKTVIPRYRIPRGYQQRFNTLHGQARVIIEHAFGMLKLKFQSLQNLPIKITRRSDIAKASSWVMACMILHNFVRDRSNGEAWDSDLARIAAMLRKRDEAIEDVLDPILLSKNNRREGMERRDRLLWWIERNDRR
ncbi:nuclease HARBI1 [Entomortierella parvispora]|uniref:Nuclease HARBI1 n=1 Tax=Entomortierella parvispora TaxID=205924 RepID=A0A9P3LY02_9FUNG|nr:nuclease HARBI1 [Entomortierella parvispora]